MSTRMHTSGVDHHLICTHNPCGHNFVHSSQSCAANSVSYSSHVTQSNHTSSRLLEHERAQALASAANPVMDVAGTNLESKHTGTSDMHAHPCHHHRATGRVEARYTATCLTLHGSGNFDAPIRLPCMGMRVRGGGVTGRDTGPQAYAKPRPQLWSGHGSSMDMAAATVCRAGGTSVCRPLRLFLQSIVTAATALMCLITD